VVVAQLASTTVQVVKGRGNLPFGRPFNTTPIASSRPQLATGVLPAMALVAALATVLLGIMLWLRG
jgi:hypothetical protein